LLGIGVLAIISYHTDSDNLSLRTEIESVRREVSSLGTNFNAQMLLERQDLHGVTSRLEAAASRQDTQGNDVAKALAAAGNITTIQQDISEIKSTTSGLPTQRDVNELRSAMRSVAGQREVDALKSQMRTLSKKLDALQAAINHENAAATGSTSPPSK
jgi:chaperonin cofactor prefoldin